MRPMKTISRTGEDLDRHASHIVAAFVDGAS
jgi:hypothetical protein